MPRLAFPALVAIWLAACAQVLGLDDPTRRDGGPGGDPPGSADAAIDADLPDAAIPCDRGACPAGLTCDLDTFERVCRPIGAAAAGALCDEPDDCAAGLTCHVGVCRTICTSSTDCATGAEGLCNIASYAGAVICDTVCDPLPPAAGSACGADRYCRPERIDVGYSTVCAGRDFAGDRGQDLPCGQGACLPGYECTEYTFGNYRCMAWCDRDHPVCPTGTTCERAYPISDSDIVLRGKKYGFCRSPAP